MNESYMPQPQLIANALSGCLEDEDLSIRKMCLDFMTKFLDVEDWDQFNNTQAVILISSLLKLVIQNDLSIVKRLAKFLFKKNDLSEVNME